MDLPVWLSLLILASVAGLSFLIGNWLARSWHMDDYGNSLGLVIGSVAFAIAVCVLLWPPKLGIDLSGGVILVYEIDEAATQRQQEAQEGPVRAVTSTDIVPAILLRLNPSGLEDVVVRPYGDDQVEVIIPRVEQAEIDRIKNIISQAGFLEFRIIANTNDHDYIIEAALDDSQRGVTQVKDEEGRTIGIWSALGKEQGGSRVGSYRMSPLSTIFRNHDTGEVITDEQGNLRPEFLPADPKERNSLLESFGDPDQGDRNVQEYFEEKLGIKKLDVLMSADDGYDVRGNHVDSVAAGFDEHGFPSINFTMTPDGAILFQGLTGENSPDPQTGFKRRLGILMDNQLISAPQLRSMISRNGQITGRFTQEEVDDLVQIIRGGSLPAALSPQPTTESQISPLLGGVTIRQSVLSLALSLVFTLAAMVFYYRFAGLVACYALLTNLIVTVAVMILLKASFTLPGIAGLLLSVGMSVDANILIFERIREELGRGAKIRMALRNGFARATVTIIDANVTTLIAGVVLYAIGTDIIRGFAVTLCLGILISMFTAVFCSRVILEIGERRHWYRDLYMVQWVKTTNIDFMGKRKLALGASMALLLIGMVGAAARGVDLLDIDLAGGTSVDVLLTEPLTETQLRERLETEKFLTVYHQVVADEMKSVSPTSRDNSSRLADLEAEMKISDFEMTLLGLPEYTDEQGQPLAFGQAWRIDTSLPSVERLQETIERIFAEGDGSQLVKRYVDFTPPETVVSEAAAPDSAATAPATDRGAQPPAATASPDEKASSPDMPDSEDETPPAAKEETAPSADGAKTSPSEKSTEEAPGPENDPRSAEPRAPAVPDEPGEDTDARLDLPGPNVFAMAGVGDVMLLAQADDAGPVNAEDQDEAPPINAQAEPAPKAESSPAANAEQQGSQAVGLARSKSDLSFRYRISDDALKFQVIDAARESGIELNADRVQVESLDDEGKEWSIELPTTPDQAQKVLGQLQADFAKTPVYPSASKIGGKVAANMQRTAISAMLLSFLGIVIYLWLRFQRVAYGLAAIVAVVHDILITMGILALTRWFAPYFGFLLIENFKISLSVIAAFLTIIGYSINDTIVIFDRVREVRGKSPHLTMQMINDSVNQTLGRTFLTGGTVLVSLLILYAVGGQGIRSFSFTLLVGIIVGTFSSVFVGPPVLLWLAEGSRKFPETQPATEKAAAATGEHL